MTINDAISRLEALKKKFGGEIEVKADCPKCGEIFIPDVVVPVRDQTHAHLRREA